MDLVLLEKVLKWRSGEARPARVCGVCKPRAKAPRAVPACPTSLEDVFRQRGLTARERHVVRERLAGRPMKAIAADPVMRRDDGRLYTRQWVELIERRAVRKLGLRRSVAATVFVQERAARAAVLAERGRRVSVVDLHADPEEVRARRPGPRSAREVELERQADALLRAAAGASTARRAAGPI